MKLRRDILVIFLAVFLLIPHISHAQVIESILSKDFEDGWGDWYPDNGVWEVGTPTAGFVECYGGDKCAGTVLDGNYPTVTRSHLISPSVEMPSAAERQDIHLPFSH
jgi:hypothetical protein